MARLCPRCGEIHFETATSPLPAQCKRCEADLNEASGLMPWMHYEDPPADASATPPPKGKARPKPKRMGKLPDGMAKLPVYNVSWDDAKAYCVARGGRLPTEAEWERAARGGLEGQDYPWGDKFDAKLLRSGVEMGPEEVGKYKPNAFGLFDMAGNVSEWTADYFEREYYAKSPAADPPGPAEGTYRIIRGGAWSDAPKRVTVYFRNWVRPTQRQANIGFRCAQASRVAPKGGG